MCDCIIGTLFNIPSKTKDTFAGRIDLQEMGVKEELNHIVAEKKTYLPSSLTKEEKHRFCETLANLKVPDGYSSNIRNLAQ